MRVLAKRLLLILCCMAAFARAEPLTKGVREVRFVAIQQPGSDTDLLSAFVHASRRNADFVLVNGVKTAGESCTDELFRSRRNAFNQSFRPLVVSPAGSDWIGCKSDDGTPNEVERLQRQRELFFEGDASLGANKIKLVRQSLNPKYRGFPENAYWQQGKILYATVHLPAENNHFLAAAGRNSEFEDRLIANRHWLERIFNLARLQKMRGIVLFADGNPMTVPARGKSTQRDGFLEMRRQIALLSSRFAGRVLLVHGRASRPATQIAWRDNLGIVGADAYGLVIAVNSSTSQVFSIARERSGGKAKN